MAYTNKYQDIAKINKRVTMGELFALAFLIVILLTDFSNDAGLF